jgi:hypothetical protein
MLSIDFAEVTEAVTVDFGGWSTTSFYSISFHLPIN